MKKFFLLTAATLMLGVPALTVQTTQAYAACVAGVRSNDVLWIRVDPWSDARKVGSIPYDACEVRVNWDRCRGRWCRVSYRGVSGWAHTRYLN